MNTRRITREFDDIALVENLAKEAFPPEEYLAPSKLIEMSEAGIVDFLALYDEGTFVGFMAISLYEKLCYMFFLAIRSAHRSKGYGGKALALLDERYLHKQQVVDFERIDFRAANNQQRLARKAFYLRNGYKETGKFISYLGVDYEILCKSESFSYDAFQRMMKTFPIEGFCPKYFKLVSKALMIQLFTDKISLENNCLLLIA